MIKIIDNIEDNDVYNQIVQLIREFVKEQVEYKCEKKYADRVINHYIALLNKIKTDKGNNSNVYCLVYKGKVIGFEIGLVQHSKRDKAIVGYKPCIYISKKHRGQQIDGKFMVSILDELVENFFKQKGVTMQKIITLETNKKHIKVYERLGYKVVKTSKGTVYLIKNTHQ